MESLSLLQSALGQIEGLITRPAESLTDATERALEFERRLARTRVLLGYLGNPQEALPVIHIGGTSGKGSTAIFCESLLLEHGLKVGAHISPYLQTPLEKVRVNRNLVSIEDTIRLTQPVMEAVMRCQTERSDLGNPHFAEAWLALALLYFDEQKCDVAVIEVGMGGRYDCTNILDPVVSAITTVSYDHVRVLGETLAEIAHHKAGIMKAGRSAIIGEMAQEARAVINEEAARLVTPLFIVGEDISYVPIQVAESGGIFTYRGMNLNLENAEVSLLGAHQFLNATTALASVECFAMETGLPLHHSRLHTGLASARFAGRLERMPGSPRVLLDGAHNPEKIEALASALRAIYPEEQFSLVVGLLKTKDAEAALRAFKGLARRVITTDPSVKGKPAIPVEELAGLMRRMGWDDVTPVAEPLSALNLAIKVTVHDDLIIVTGSLFLVGMIRAYWHPNRQIEAQQTMFTT